MALVSLPTDDGFRPKNAIQWWYWAGLLEARDGRRFGYQLVFFGVEVVSSPFGMQLAESAISDLSRGTFRSRERLFPGVPKNVPSSFELADPDGVIRAQGGDGRDHLFTEVDGYRLELDVVAKRPATLHYGGDRHAYAFGGDSCYYSRTALEAKGRVTTPDGASHEVTGRSWFDRQWGDLAQSVLVGWQWFAIQLDDGRQVVLYDYNRRPTEDMGALVDDQGARPLRSTDFSVVVTRTWTSPKTQIVYPARWEIAVNGGPSLSVEPLVADQEMSGKFWVGPQYWEGVCSVRGTRGETGHAFVELVGFEPRSGR